MALVKSLWEKIVDLGTRLLGQPEPPAPRRRRPRQRRRVDGKLPSKPRTVHRVRQVYDTSCGVAVTAMLARVSHKQALDAIFPKRARRTTFYTSYKDVMRGLTHFGVPHARRSCRVSSFETIPGTALVKVKIRTSASKFCYHWVILQKLDEGFHIIDPQPPRPGTLRLGANEYARHQPISYLLVTPKLPEEP